VVFGKWSGTEVLIGGEDGLIFEGIRYLGVIEGDARAARRVA
jgi:hypothetical protein